MVTLKRGELFSVVRLPWAQEAWSSNLHAPTISLRVSIPMVVTPALGFIS